MTPVWRIAGVGYVEGAEGEVLAKAAMRAALNERRKAPAIAATRPAFAEKTNAAGDDRGARTANERNRHVDSNTELFGCNGVR